MKMNKCHYNLHDYASAVSWGFANSLLLSAILNKKSYFNIQLEFGADWLYLGADPGGTIGVIAPPNTYKSNFIHHNFLQFRKQHSQLKVILSSIVLSQRCCEVYIISPTVAKRLWDLTNQIFLKSPPTSRTGWTHPWLYFTSRFLKIILKNPELSLFLWDFRCFNKLHLFSNGAGNIRRGYLNLAKIFFSSCDL